MKVLGLITEYNPFHNGHKYHLMKSKKITNSTHIVVAMSGNFLQRGEPALINKWTRAKMAIREGADLVIEVPTVFACNSAEYFALGSIGTLNSLNIVNSICFGSEMGSIDTLDNLADIFINEPLEFKNILKIYLSKGDPFPVARQKAISNYFNNNEYNNILNNPNNILGIEYLKALRLLNSKIKPITIKRIKAHYNSRDINGKICSATAIRELLNNNIKKINELESVMPNNSYEILRKSIKEGKGPVFLHNLEDIILYKFRTMSLDRLKEIHDVNEGFENRLKKASIEAQNFYDFIDRIKTKRYPLTRIQRIIIKTLLEMTKNDVQILTKEKGPQYIRVLGFSEAGTSLLRELKTKAKIPIIINLNKHIIKNDYENKMLEYDILASDIFNLFTNKDKYRKGGTDFTESPYINFKSRD